MDWSKEKPLPLSALYEGRTMEDLEKGKAAGRDLVYDGIPVSYTFSFSFISDYPWLDALSQAISV